MTVTRTEIVLDVTDSVDAGESLTLGATVVAPTTRDHRADVVLIAIPGGSYNCRYWDLRPPGRSGYSNGEYWAERGFIVVACDYLGGGDGSRPANGDVITLLTQAEAAHAVCEQIRTSVADGTLLDRLPPSPDAVFVGVGQSLGGFVTIVQQGRFGDYAALGIFGSPVWGVANVRNAGADEMPMYFSVSRALLRGTLYTADVAEDLVRYDEVACQTLVPRLAAVDGWTDGFALPFAELIRVPVFLAFGDADLSDDPHRELSAYPASPDVTVTVVPRMAHMHNFADTRVDLWQRFDGWLRSLFPLH